MIVSDQSTLELTRVLGGIFNRHFPSTKIYLLPDVVGEDHIYVSDEEGRPAFDALVSRSRKFFFLWYYQLPSKGLKLVDKMRKASLGVGMDFVVKFPNVPTNKPSNPNSKVGNKGLYPTIVRFGNDSSERLMKDFIVKVGNPQLEKRIYTESALEGFRLNNWHLIPGGLEKILNRSKSMLDEKFAKTPDRKKNIVGYYLYAGCALSHSVPTLGFGMRDIDVEVLFSPEWYCNTRCAYTRFCDIKEFGEPAYFNGKTRWLDLMYNSLHKTTGNSDSDLLAYIEEMRQRSDRWATMSQRPFINLETRRVVYWPNWLKSLMALKGVACEE